MDYSVQTGRPSQIHADKELTSTQAVLQERRDGLTQRLRDGALASEVVAGFTETPEPFFLSESSKTKRFYGNT